MIEPKVTFERATVRGGVCSQYVHEMRWLGQIIEYELEQKKTLLKETENVSDYNRQLRLQKKIKRCKTVITGCSELIRQYRSALKTLQRTDPNNMKKKAS